MVDPSPEPMLVTSQTDAAAATRPQSIMAWVLILLVVRALAAHFMAFFQNDEISLAAGAAALSRHSIGDVYRYGPQAGYYRLVQGLSALFGGVGAIPLVMIWLSVIAGVVIPACGLAAFPGLLSRTERWVLAGLLAVHPMLWMSATYGNSAMPSTALLVLAVTILSNRPGSVWETIALTLYGAAIFVRADAVLAFLAVALVLWLRFHDVATVLRRLVPLVLGLAALYIVLFAVDPRMASAVGAVTEHLTNPSFQTRFWDYLLWSTSPFILAFAVLGVRELLLGRRELLGFALAWCLPYFVFYYGATTSPRYFVPTAMPVAMCAAVGAVALARLLSPARPRLAAGAVALLATLHLFVGLSHFTPGSPKNLLRQADVPTQVGPLWTGAYLYKSYLVPSFLGRSVRHPKFGRINGTQWALDSSLAAVAGGAARGRTVAVLLSGWMGHAFHYYALLHGADYTSRALGPAYATETWMTLGGARLMSIQRFMPTFRAMATLPVAEGDQVWVLAWDADQDSVVQNRLPAGLTRVTIGNASGPVRQFRLERSGP